MPIDINKVPSRRRAVNVSVKPSYWQHYMLIEEQDKNEFYQENEGTKV